MLFARPLEPDILIFYFQVFGFDPRPLLKITPPSSAKDRRIKSFNYIEAVRNLPTNFSPLEVDSILQRINNPRLIGRMRSTFIVLSDDDYRRKLFMNRSRDKPSDEAVPAGVGSPASGANAQPVSGEHSSGHKSRSSSKSKSGGGSKSGSKSFKRGADTSEDTNPSKK